MPIGAGLVATKKPVKKVRAYREGGSWSGTLFVIFVVCLAGYGFVAQPWSNNWRPLRKLVGMAPEADIAGQWNVEKLVQLNTKTKQQLFQYDMTSGRVNFKETGKVSLAIQRTQGEMKGEGVYKVKENRLLIDKLTGSPPEEIAPKLAGKVVNTTADNIIAMFDTGTAIFLRRESDREKIAKVLAYKMMGDRLKKTGGDE